MTAQEEFDRKYITASEIIQRVGVTRSAVIQAQNKGTLPSPIMVGNHMAIWIRDEVETHVESWRKRREERIGVA